MNMCLNGYCDKFIAEKTLKGYHHGTLQTFTRVAASSDWIKCVTYQCHEEDSVDKQGVIHI